MRFSTFSTGFSTTKGHQPYTHRNSGRSFLVSFGQKCGHSAFYKKESRRIFFSFYSSFRLTIRSLSRLEKRSPEFSTERERRFFVWKKRGKLRFSTVCHRSPAESAPHAVFAPECVQNRAIACVPSRSVPSKKTPSVTVHAVTEGVFLFYIILRNTSCAIWKYRIKLQASTMVVLSLIHI